ncbi:MAG: prenyltransferase/squalene oxidase repeat-containing protein [Planctomycetota bacterium]
MSVRKMCNASSAWQWVAVRKKIGFAMFALLAWIDGTCVLGIAAHGQEAFEKDDVDAAVSRAIQYLVTQQKPNGSITDRGSENAMTALAIMAMASVGHQPADSSAEGVAMARGLKYLLSEGRQDKAGYFGAADGSRMYGHGIVSLMLTEMLGMTLNEGMDEEVHTSAQKAIDLIVRSQRVKKGVNARGGWRYTPDAGDSDLSVSVWQLMALRSAKNDGLDVSSKTIEDAVGYLKRSFSSPLDSKGTPRDAKNGFTYEANGGGPTFTMTSAGLLAMQVCGQYDSPLVSGAADWLLEHPPNWNERFILYGLYYFAQGMHQRGGDHAERAAKIVSELLLSKQKQNGAWESSGGEEQNAGSVYCTSMAVLSLSVKYHYLPIYQR